MSRFDFAAVRFEFPRIEQQLMAERERQRAQVEWQDGRISVVNDAGQVQVKLPGVEVNVPQGPLVDVPQTN